MQRAPVLVLALAGVLVVGCSQEDPPGPREGVTAQELTGDVSGDVDLDTAVVGGRISLEGDVTRVLTPSAFEISPADGATTRPVLVLGEQADLAPGQSVQVVGIVRLLLDDDQAVQAGQPSPGRLPTHDGKRIVEAHVIDVPSDRR